MAAFQTRHNQFNTMTHPLDDKSVFHYKTEFEEDSYWPAYFNSFLVKALYMGPIHKPIGTAERHAHRAPSS